MIQQRKVNRYTGILIVFIIDLLLMVTLSS